MAKIRISASISEKVKQEAIIVAQKRGLKFSQLIERALINEINRKSDNGIKAELEDIKEYINGKIARLDVLSEENIEIKDIDYYINEINEIHNIIGYVSYGVIEANAKKAGVSTEELIKAINSKGFDFNITD